MVIPHGALVAALVLQWNMVLVLEFFTHVAPVKQLLSSTAVHTASALYEHFPFIPVAGVTETLAVSHNYDVVSHTAVVELHSSPILGAVLMS